MEKESITRDEALKYHNSCKPGKLEVIPSKPSKTKKDLSLAYTPGVAYPCLEIQKNPIDAYKYTNKSNLVAVITNGTAVLGLGDIGALASKPVMEGKGVLFKIFADIDVFDIEINEKDPEKFCSIVESISPTFGGINLEDIKAPECFEIEKYLKEKLDIPVMHDDQHGTAIVSAAALLNALEMTGKNIKDAKVVINGAGAAAIACGRLYKKLGAENIIMLDSKGVITENRTDINKYKREFAVKEKISSLEDAIKGADVFLGLSKGDILTKEMILSMNKNPVIFALANPYPEIKPEKAFSIRKDIIMATGRSDYPNQINNVIAFPYIFRGALDTFSRDINNEMILAAVEAIAETGKRKNLLIPSPFDKDLLENVSFAVAKASVESGSAKIKNFDFEEYRIKLKNIRQKLEKIDVFCKQV
ncbi:MAG: malate dehydrogenase [Aquificae bacterium]|nr:malate dehydrogenase [Aquificota bacterium]